MCLQRQRAVKGQDLEDKRQMCAGTGRVGVGAAGGGFEFVVDRFAEVCDGVFGDEVVEGLRV